MRARTFSLLSAILIATVALAGCGEVNSVYTLEDELDALHGITIFKALLTEPAFKDLADRVAPVTIFVDVKDSEWNQVFYYDYDEGYLATTGVTASPDFTVRTSRDLALSVVNAREDGFRVFACALKDNAVTLEATNLIYAASLNAAKGRITGSATDCAPVDGREVSFRGLKGTLADGTPRGLPRHIAPMATNPLTQASDALAFNKYGGPVSWHEISCLIPNLADGTFTRWCGGAGYSATSSDRTACADAVNEAYAKEDTTGWDAGLVAGQKVRKAAELATCKLVFGGS